MQPEFNRPEFLEGNSAEEIHERMMNNLPDDIDDMPGGFPYDMTMPAALEKDEIINFHIVRALMISFPEYAHPAHRKSPASVYFSCGTVLIPTRFHSVIKTDF